VLCGVRQGSLFSSYLFNLFIDVLKSELILLDVGLTIIIYRLLIIIVVQKVHTLKIPLN